MCIKYVNVLSNSLKIGESPLPLFLQRGRRGIFQKNIILKLFELGLIEP